MKKSERIKSLEQRLNPPPPVFLGFVERMGAEYDEYITGIQVAYAGTVERLPGETVSQLEGRAAATKPGYGVNFVFGWFEYGRGSHELK